MRDKRIKLFRQLVDLAYEREEIEQFEDKYKDYNGWESFNFKNTQAVTDLYDKTIKLDIFPNTSKIEDFFKKFACDLSWAKQTTYCAPTQTDIYSCVKVVHTNFTTSAGVLNVKVTDTKTYSFFSNNRFLYKDGTTSLKGSWYCDAVDNYNVKLDNGQTYSSKNKVWSVIPKVVEAPPSNGDVESPKKSEGTKTNVITKSGNNKVIYGTDAIIY
jgi:hypothetical protein